MFGDTINIFLLLLLGAFYTGIRANEADTVIQNELSIKNGYFTKGESFLKKNIDSSKYYFYKALQSYQAQPDSFHIAQCFKWLAYCATRQNEWDTAIYYAKRSTLYCDSTDCPELHLEAQFTIAETLLDKNELKKACTILNTLDLNRKLSPANRVRLASDYAIFYYFQKDYKRGLAKLLEGLKYVDNTVDIPNKIRYYDYLGFFYGATGEHLKAVKFLKKALKLAKQIDNEYYKVAIYSSLSESYRDLKDYKNAIFYAQKTSQYYKEENPTKFLNAQCRLADLYTLSGAYSKAKKILDEIDKEIKNQKDSETRSLYFLSRINYYSHTGDFRKATEFSKNYFLFNDSLRAAINDSEINKLMVQYETKKKEEENKLLSQQLLLEKKEKEKETLKKKITLFGFLLILLAFISLLTIFYFYKKNNLHRRALNAAKIKQKEEEKKQLEQEKEIIKSKLQTQKNILESTNLSLLQQSQLSEFLFTTLKSLRPYCNKEGKKEITSNIAQLQSISKEKNWRTFEQNFLLLHPEFFNNLQERFPKLTPSEKKICAFMKLGLSTPEMCQITMQSKLSIYRYKKSIREKLGQKDNESLETFVKEI